MTTNRNEILINLFNILNDNSLSIKDKVAAVTVVFSNDTDGYATAMSAIETKNYTTVEAVELLEQYDNLILKSLSTENLYLRKDSESLNMMLVTIVNGEEILSEVLTMSREQLERTWRLHVNY